MRIYTRLDSLQLNNPTVCGLGNFDGIHIGHQMLIKKVVDIADKKGLEPTIITFHPHPSKILTPTESVPLIITLDQKKEIFRQLGIKNLVLLPFNRRFSEITYNEFIKYILIDKCKSKVNVVGYDYTFGHKGRGNAELLKRACIKEAVETYIVPPITFNDTPISSSLIRKLIRSGELTKVTELLGRPFSITGNVVNGNKIGKKLGFPTANINLPENIVLPPRGVYATIINIDDCIYKGAANLGFKPTFNEKTINLEVHLFNFTQDIYSEKIEIFFVARMRKEKKFDTVFDLKKQVKKDFVKASNILEKSIYNNTSLRNFD